MGLKTYRLAVLFDLENMSRMPLVERVLAAASKYGILAIKRAYGNWDNPEISIWKKCLATHEIETMQLLDNSGAKNASDITMIIDAMDILHSGDVDGFCIVSSDPHFASLARKIRREGMFVAAIGQEAAPRSLREACDTFLQADELPHPTDRRVQSAAPGWRDTIREAIKMSASGDGWVLLSTLMGNIMKIDPSFATHDFCHSGMRSLVQSCPDEFEVSDCLGGGKPAAWHVRIRQDPRQ